MPREEFPATTKDVIAKRAGYRCSFPECDRLLVGPGVEPNTAATYGECAHIYAAKQTGPRGQNYLSVKDLIKAENGIYLCKEHHKQIDSTRGRVKFSAQLLSIYKEMHENAISAEVGSMLYPVIWIKYIKIIHSPLLKDSVQYDLTKTTLISGLNGVGKSLLIEYVYTALTGKCSSRLRKGYSEILICLSNPVKSDISCKINNSRVSYVIDGETCAFSPFNLEVFYIKDITGNTKGDCVNRICATIERDREFVKSMIEGCKLQKGYIVNQARLETVRTKPYETIRINVRRTEDKPNGPEFTFGSLSSTEQKGTMVDWFVEYLIEMSKYKNVLLLMDWNEFQTFDDGMKNYYLSLIHDASSHFQSIITTHTLWQEVNWSGWSLLSMNDDHIDIKRDEIT